MGRSERTQSFSPDRTEVSIADQMIEFCQGCQVARSLIRWAGVKLARISPRQRKLLQLTEQEADKLQLLLVGLRLPDRKYQFKHWGEMDLSSYAAIVVFLAKLHDKFLENQSGKDCLTVSPLLPEVLSFVAQPK